MGFILIKYLQDSQCNGTHLFPEQALECLSWMPSEAVGQSFPECSQQCGRVGQRIWVQFEALSDGLES